LVCGRLLRGLSSFGLDWFSALPSASGGLFASGLVWFSGLP
jgi:hypothetical protein